MAEYDQKLVDILKHLQGNWTVEDYQLAGMGWATVLNNKTNTFTLHSERGWVDIYLGQLEEKNVLGCENTAAEIAEVINANTA